MRVTTQALCLLGGILFALPGGSHAATVLGARVRWQGSGDPATTGYHVWVRPVNGTASTPRDAGMPAASGGTFSFVVDDLDPRADYAVSVSAYTGDGTETAHSNELPIGYAQFAPVIDTDGDGLSDAAEDPNLNRVVDAGETDATRADTDGDAVRDAADRCSATAASAEVNAEGCSCAQVTCDDGNACNGVESCRAGVCQAGTVPNCDDGNPCTTDGCRAASGCTHTTVPACTGCTTDAQCEDGNSCTTDVCRAGTCAHAAVADGTTCGDGNVCNGSEACRSGTCAAGTPLDCDDGNRCTVDACTPQGGCTHTADAYCGACPGATVVPAEGGTFTGETSGTSHLSASCEPTTASTADVVFAWTPARSGVTTISTCGPATKFDTVLALRPGSCDATQELCNDDSEGCSIDDGRQRASRHGSTITTQVQAGETYYIVLDGYSGQHGAFSLTVTAPAVCTNASCDDGNPCTADTCDPERGCSHTAVADGTTCDDGLFCTVGETCQSGSCTMGQPNCAGATDACQTGNCDEANDRCFTTPRADGTACSDGNVCNGSETCQAGHCTSSASPDCDDHNPCTVDSCDATGGCGHAPAADGTSCDNSSFCNGAEVCQSGACVASAPPSCDDGNACTTDTCNEAEKRCGHGSLEGCCAVDADCADQDACTTNERCREGRCVSDAVVCPDAGACGESTCDPQRGCSEVARPEGGACEDGDPCTLGERCSLGVCAVPTTQASDTTSGGELKVNRFVLRPLGRRGQLMIAEGVFTGPWASNASATGLTTQLMKPNGEVLYNATVAPDTLHPRVWRNRLVYIASEDSSQAVGLRRLVLNTTAEGTRVTIRAIVPRKIGKAASQRTGNSQPTAKERFSWAVWVGGSCVRDPAVSCARSGRGKRCG